MISSLENWIPAQNGRLGLLLSRFPRHPFVLRARFFFHVHWRIQRLWTVYLGGRLFVAFFLPWPTAGSLRSFAGDPAPSLWMETGTLITRKREISSITVIHSEYLRESLDALKCSLMNQPMFVTDQGGKQGCDVTKDCRLNMKKKITTWKLHICYNIEKGSRISCSWHADPLPWSKWNLKMSQLTVTNNDMTLAFVKSRSLQTQ